MTTKLTLHCDIPGCSTTTVSPGLASGSAEAQRDRAARAGWTTTRVANPFSGDPGEPKTYQLDRCPQHATIALRMIRVSERTYRIETKDSRTP